MTKDEQEREANQFAMALLMPEKLVLQYVKDHPDFDLTDDDWMKQMAKTFAVSSTCAALRLQQLRIFRV